jgi:hypothetical protein
MRLRIFLPLPMLLVLSLAACRAAVTPAPAMATVYVTFDMGGGGAGFAASLFAQEVTTGKTFKGFAPAGSHGGVVLPTSPAVGIQVEAPGTYVFYATLINDPESYQFGATGCLPGTPCPASSLTALDVEPGGVYHISVGDRSADIPTPGAPVTVPWHR